jgi:hypothetical protein
VPDLLNRAEAADAVCDDLTADDHPDGQKPGLDPG